MEVKQTYEKPLIRKITLQQAKIILRSKFQNIVRVIRPGSSVPMMKPEAARKYEKPEFKRLTLEQAKLLLIGRANIGDEQAADLLYTIFNDPNSPQKGHF